MDQACSRRPVVWRRLHAIFMRRLQERRSWVVYFFDFEGFGDRDAPRRGRSDGSLRVDAVFMIHGVHASRDGVRATQLLSKDMEAEKKKK